MITSILYCLQYNQHNKLITPHQGTLRGLARIYREVVYTTYKWGRGVGRGVDMSTRVYLYTFSGKLPYFPEIFPPNPLILLSL